MNPFRALASLGVLALVLLPASAANYSASLKAGKAELKSVGPLAFGPDGMLYVSSSSSRTTNQILRYNPTTGAFVDVFVPSIAWGLFMKNIPTMLNNAIIYVEIQ